MSYFIHQFAVAVVGYNVHKPFWEKNLRQLMTIDRVFELFGMHCAHGFFHRASLRRGAKWPFAMYGAGSSYVLCIMYRVTNRMNYGILCSLVCVLLLFFSVNLESSQTNKLPVIAK